MLITKERERMYTMETSTKTLQTPFFFPSISSVRTNYNIRDYLSIFKKDSHTGLLVSAYDIFKDEKKDELIEDVSKLTNTQTFTILDSGNYESYWKNDNKWGIEEFKSVLSNVNVDFSFSFDIFYSKGKDLKDHIRDTVRNTAMTASFQKLGTTIPIIHSSSEVFPAVVDGVIEGISPEIIGITERELGTDLIQRAETLLRIRKRVDSTRPEIPIHMLGTGNPASILIYTLCGADTFDALEWCTTVVDPSNGLLRHFVQKDLIQCGCKACKSSEGSYGERTISHNLIFYENFLKEIREAIRRNEIESVVAKYLPKHFIPKLRGICEKSESNLLSK